MPGACPHASAPSPRLLRTLRALGLQPWLPRRWVHKLIRRLAPHTALPPTPFEVPFFGFRYQGDLSGWLDWNVYFTGAYSLNELLLMADLAKYLKSCGKRVVLYDVGANVGQHSLFMSRHADEIHAFEPLRRSALELERKLAKNAVSNVTLHELALGDAEATSTIYLPDRANFGKATLVASAGQSGAAAGTERIRVVRGDDYVAAQELPPVSILKLDVEGYESAVLAGLRATLLRDRPFLLTEITGASRSGFGDEAGFRAALYPDHTLFRVRARRRGYRLRPYTIAAREVLCVPNEHLAACRAMFGW